jgi:NTP pyrophosphatase (non-canonical NTP hydrolase)
MIENPNVFPRSYNIFAMIKEMQTAAHGVAHEKGWWDAPHKTPGECLLLIHAEVSEAAETLRVPGTPLLYCENGKPEGISAELADVILRVLDFAEFHGLDLSEALRQKHAYNKTRAYKHEKAL